MDFVKATGRRLTRSLSEQVSSLRTLKDLMGFERTPKVSLPERMVRRYSAVSEDDDEDESRPNVGVLNIFRRRRRPSSGKNKSNRFTRMSRHMSMEDVEFNKQRLELLGGVMTAFYDHEDDASSDQDDLVGELIDIGYFKTPKNMSSNTTIPKYHDGTVFKQMK